MQVLFKNRGKGIVNCASFESSKTAFSQNFQFSLNSASEFVNKFQELTTYNTIEEAVMVTVTDEEDRDPAEDNN